MDKHGSRKPKNIYLGACAELFYRNALAQNIQRAGKKKAQVDDGMKESLLSLFYFYFFIHWSIQCRCIRETHPRPFALGNTFIYYCFGVFFFSFFFFYIKRCLFLLRIFFNVARQQFGDVDLFLRKGFLENKTKMLEYFREV